jgi:thiol-disulfide isomerase/thioredoxin
MRFAFSLVGVLTAGLIFIGCQEAHSESPQGTAQAGSAEDKELKIGDQAPAWKDLAGTDDKQHSLNDLEKSKVVVVVFTCNTCPVAQAYEDRLIKLTNDYKDKGVAVMAINVNKDPNNSLDAMKQRAEKKG